MCLGIAHLSGKVPLSGQGVWQIHNASAPCALQIPWGEKGQMHCVSARPLVPREGLYQIHGQSLNTHRGKHRSGGAQRIEKIQSREAILKKSSFQYAMKFSIENGFFIPGPSLTAEKHLPGIEVFNRE